MKAILGGLCVGWAVVMAGTVGGCASSGQTPPPAATAGAVRQGAPDAVPTGRPVYPSAGAASGGAAASPAAAASTGTGGGDKPVAQVNGLTITTAQFLAPLIEAHGLNTLLSLVQLELAKQAATEQHVTVSEEDFVKERAQTLGQLFQESDQAADEQIQAADKAGQKERADKLRQQKQEDHDQLLDQFLTKQHITPGEFDIVLRTNTYLRKIAEPLLAGKITEEMVQKKFAEKYGEQVRVRHIECTRPQDALRARARAVAGEPFDKLAIELSKNPRSAPVGGELPVFSRTDPRLPDEFKQAAFALQPGQLSDVVQTDNSYHIIKMEERILPKAVKYEVMRPVVFDELHELYVQSVIKTLRDRIGDIAREKMHIDDPVLAQQFAKRLAQREAALKGRDKAMEQIERENQEAATPAGPPAPATTGPTTNPAVGPAAPSTIPAASPATAPVAPVAPRPAPAPPAAPAATAPAATAPAATAPAAAAPR